MAEGGEPEPLFSKSTSVILIGDDRPFLNWVAFALASATDPGFLWVDARPSGEVLSERDPINQNVIAASRFAAVRPSALAPDHARANIAVSAVVRDDEPPESLQLLMDFLRLPERTQARLSEIVATGPPRVVVLSNAHRLIGYYTVESVGPLMKAILSTGIVVLMTYADAPTDGRFGFTIVLHLEGRDPNAWRQASLRVEKGLATGIFRQGATHRLSEIEPIAKVLSQHLG